MPIEWDVYLGSLDSQGKIPSFGRVTNHVVKEKIREDRSASGVLKQDILYVKNEFKLTFAKCTESTINILEYWYNQYRVTKTPLPLYMYTSPTEYNQYSVIPRPISKTRLVKATDNLFSNVVFQMVEV